MPPTVIRNFGGNVEFSPQLHFQPQNQAEVLELLNLHRGKRIRVGGSLHSWTPAVETDDVFLELRHLQDVKLSSDEQGPLATIGAGCQIKRILTELDRVGLTLPSLGLISEQTIAGAISTATHGSGKHSLSHYIQAVHLAHYDHETGAAKISIISAGDDLRAAQCALGCLGVVVAVELRPRASYHIEEVMRQYPTVEAVLAGEADWPLQQFFYLPWHDRFLAQHRRETKQPRSWLAPLYRAYWFLVVDLGLHLVLRLIVQRLRSTAGVKFLFRWIASPALVRNWRVVDKSQDMLIMEHELFRHIEIEVFVARSQLPAAMALTQQLLRHFDNGVGLSEENRQKLTACNLAEALAKAPHTYTHHYAICVRRILPDNTLVAMTSGGDEDFYALSFISYALPSERAGFFGFAHTLAQSMTKLFAARCHWGKVCPLTSADVNRLYPQVELFRTICTKYDADGRFQNDWVRGLLFEPANTNRQGGTDED